MPNTINIGTTQALEFKLVGDHSSSTLSFSLYETSGGSALFTKSGTSITKVYNAPYTFIQVAILKGDTSGLTGGYKDYTISGTSGVLESGSIYCSPVTHNAGDPLSQFDRLTTRIIAMEASEFDNGDFLRVVETDGVKSFINLTPAEVRTALDVAKVQAGTATDLYLKWNNSTSKWETRTLAEIQGDLGDTIISGSNSSASIEIDNIIPTSSSISGIFIYTLDFFAYTSGSENEVYYNAKYIINYDGNQGIFTVISKTENEVGENDIVNSYFDTEGANRLYVTNSSGNPLSYKYIAKRYI